MANSPQLNTIFTTPTNIDRLYSVEGAVYEKIGVGEDQNQYVRYASKISGNDLEFLATLEAENGLWKLDRQSEVRNAYGVREDSWGFCQILRTPEHAKILDDPRFFTDGFWQLEQCWKLYQEGTTFYGRNRLKSNAIFRQKIYSRFVLTNF